MKKDCQEKLEEISTSRGWDRPAYSVASLEGGYSCTLIAGGQIFITSGAYSHYNAKEEAAIQACHHLTVTS
ncbi:hypothetical protein HI914_06729 [Erysiphe necator]|nr:hypothetical protein HI914_06729 [Erysiphe necator]